MRMTFFLIVVSFQAASASCFRLESTNKLLKITTDKLHKIENNWIQSGHIQNVSLNENPVVSHILIRIQQWIQLIELLLTHNPSHKLLRPMWKMVLFRFSTSNVKLV